MRCEKKAEEWHFSRSGHEDKVSDERLRRAHHRLDEKDAIAAKEKARAETDAHVAGLLKAAEEEDVRRAREIAELRAEIFSIEDAIECEREACDAEVTEVERQIEVERSRCKGIESQMQDEKKNSAEARHRIDEIEHDEAAQMRTKERLIKGCRATGAKEVHRLETEAEKQVHEIELQLQSELADLQRQIDAAQKACGSSVGECVQGRQDVIKGSYVEASDIDKRVQEQLRAVHTDVLDMHVDCVARMDRVRERELDQERAMVAKTAEVCGAVHQVEQDKNQASSVEFDNRRRMLQSEDVLGGHFPSSNQYPAVTEQRLRTALSICAGQA